MIYDFKIDLLCLLCKEGAHVMC